jgi:hypothetical protein
MLLLSDAASFAGRRNRIPGWRDLPTRLKRIGRGCRLARKEGRKPVPNSEKASIFGGIKKHKYLNRWIYLPFNSRICNIQLYK